MISAGRVCRTSLLALAGLGLGLAPVAAAGSAAAELAAAQHSLRAGQAPTAVRELEAAARSVPAAGAVASELRAGQRSAAARQLFLLSRSIASRPGQPGPRAVKAAVASVYRNAQLADLGRPAGRANSLISQLANLLRQLALLIFHAVGDSIWIALALLVLIAGLGLAAVLWRRGRARLGPAPETRPEPGRPAGPRPDRLFARAEQLRLEGRFAESVRLAFQALLLSASERRVLAVDPSWTNSELLRAATQVGALEPALRPLVAKFNRVVYGGEDPGPDGCSQFASDCRSAAAGLAP